MSPKATGTDSRNLRHTILRYRKVGPTGSGPTTLPFSCRDQKTPRESAAPMQAACPIASLFDRMNMPVRSGGQSCPMMGIAPHGKLAGMYAPRRIRIRAGRALAQVRAACPRPVPDMPVNLECCRMVRPAGRAYLHHPDAGPVSWRRDGARKRVECHAGRRQS